MNFSLSKDDDCLHDIYFLMPFLSASIEMFYLCLCVYTSPYTELMLDKCLLNTIKNKDSHLKSHKSSETELELNIRLSWDHPVFHTHVCDYAVKWTNVWCPHLIFWDPKASWKFTHSKFNMEHIQAKWTFLWWHSASGPASLFNSVWFKISNYNSKRSEIWASTCNTGRSSLYLLLSWCLCLFIIKDLSKNWDGFDSMEEQQQEITDRHQLMGFMIYQVVCMWQL